MKLNPAVRTGLIWAGVHQAWTLCAMACLSVDAAVLSALVALPLWVLDIPAKLVLSALPLPYYFPVELPDSLRSTASGFLWMLIFGALQWFLIGYAVGVRRSRREVRERAL